MFRRRFLKPICGAPCKPGRYDPVGPLPQSLLWEPKLLRMGQDRRFNSPEGMDTGHAFKTSREPDLCRQSPAWREALCRNGRFLSLAALDPDFYAARLPSACRGGPQRGGPVHHPRASSHFRCDSPRRRLEPIFGPYLAFKRALHSDGGGAPDGVGTGTCGNPTTIQPVFGLQAVFHSISFCGGSSGGVSPGG